MDELKTKFLAAKTKLAAAVPELIKPIKHTIYTALDAPEKRYIFYAILIAIDLLLAYLISVIHVGIWISDCSLSGIIAEYLSSDSTNYPFWLFLLLTVALCIAAYFLLYRSLIDPEDRNFNLSESNIYGNAREISNSELSEVADICPKDEAMGTILGQLDRTEKHLICTKPNANSNGNIAIFGSPGSGKSFCIVKPFICQAIRRGESVLVTDSKGEVWADTVELARMHGYTIRRIDLKNPEFSDGWNVLSELRCDDMRAMIFAQTVMMNTGNTSDPHLSAEQSLLKAVCLYQERHPMIPPEEKTFYNAYRMLMSGADELDKTFRAIRYDSNLRVAYDAYMTFFSGSPNLRGNIISNLCDRLQVLSSMPIRKLTSTPDIDLTLPGKQRCIYYVVVSDQHSTMKFMSSLFFSFAFQDLVDLADKQLSRRLPVKVNFLMEEFANCIGYLPNLTQYLSTCRSRAIDIILILQSLGQLKSIYGEDDTNIILADCATHLCIGFNDQDTAELFEWRAGEATVKVKTEQHAAVDPVVRLGLPHSTGDGRRNFYTSNELMKMKTGRCFIVWQRYDCKMAYTFGINKHIEYEQGRMPTILTDTHIKLADTEARAYLRAAEEQRVMDYEAWLAAGGNPWRDYRTPEPEIKGPAANSPLPKYKPYPKLEEEALAQSAQLKETTKEKQLKGMSEVNEVKPSDVIPAFELPEDIEWTYVQSQVDGPVSENSAPEAAPDAPEGDKQNPQGNSSHKPKPTRHSQKVAQKQTPPNILDNQLLGVPGMDSKTTTDTKKTRGASLYATKKVSDILNETERN